jgi:hypothetical protein
MANVVHDLSSRPDFFTVRIRMLRFKCSIRQPLNLGPQAKAGNPERQTEIV